MEVCRPKATVVPVSFSMYRCGPSPHSKLILGTWVLVAQMKSTMCKYGFSQCPRDTDDFRRERS